ncbi:MAG: HAMP domain-containing protein, partial [Burkholderiales bacterium]|nr:HAMP domain-containing protein [Burkholderiales bacterium]
MALVIGGGIQAAMSYGQAVRLTQQLQQLEARVVASKVEGFMGNIARVLESISRMPWGAGDLRESARVVELNTLLRLAPAVSDVSWQDENRVEQVFVSRIQPDRFSPQRSKSKFSLIREPSTRAQIVSAPQLVDGLDYSAVMAVRDSQGRGGTTLATVNLRFVSSVVENLRFGNTGLSYIVDTTGNVIAHPNIAIAMRQNREAHRTTGAAPTSRETSTGLSPLGLVIKQDKVLSSVLIGDTGWRVVVEQDASEVLTPVYAALLQTVLLLGIVLLLALFAGRILSDRIVKPIEVLDREVSRLARGDLTSRATESGTDEISKLARTFNSMSSQLQSYTISLEQKVSEKTAQLELANRHKSEFLANMSHELRTPLNAV